MAGDIPVLEDAKLHDVRVAVPLCYDILKGASGIGGESHADVRLGGRPGGGNLPVGMGNLVGCGGRKTERKGQLCPKQHGRRVNVGHVLQHPGSDFVAVECFLIVLDTTELGS